MLGSYRQQMALNVRFLAAHILVCSFLSVLTFSSGGQSDIYCLKSIKDSLEDPYGYLNAIWKNFDNQTEGFICNFPGIDCWRPDHNRVLNIRLSDMGLGGMFPMGIENCTGLTGLDLSGNELWGPIPSSISRLWTLTSLDLSSNNFSGQIPSSLANCSYLNALKLDNNRLTGRIPESVGQLTRIKVFSVANNLLSGPVPNFGAYAVVSAYSYANNTGLCGGPLEPCHPDQKHELKSDLSFKSGFVIGFVVFAVSVTTIYLSYCVPWVHLGVRRETFTITTLAILMMKRKIKANEVIQVTGLPTTAANLQQEENKKVLSLERLVQRMKFQDLCKATDNFSRQNIIGSGQLGIVFKATLTNGTVCLAVKRMHDSQHLEQQFVSEIKILGRLKHANLVPLLGFCTMERILIYKYMPNGSLYDWLHSVNGKSNVLGWHLRVRIAIGLARALAWLHRGKIFHVAHLRLNSKCILLDQSFEPKLSNFEMAMLVTPNKNQNKEFWRCRFAKEDVFSFGIVILELITGKEPSKIIQRSSNKVNGRLAEWVTHIYNCHASLYDAIDKSLIGQGFDAQIFQFLGVAGDCIRPFPIERPTMPEAYKMVRSIGEKIWPDR